jgi:hypothetical protein
LFPFENCVKLWKESFLHLWCFKVEIASVSSSYTQQSWKNPCISSRKPCVRSCSI